MSRLDASPHRAPRTRAPLVASPWASLLCAAALTACAFEPVYLDAERPLDGLDEVAGIDVDGEGFVVVGSRFDRDGEARTAIVVAAGEDGAVESSRTHELVRASGVLVLPDGDRLVYGHAGSVHAMRVAPDGTERWRGRLGAGQSVRAAILTGNRVALAGSAHVSDGGGSRDMFWFALLDPDAGPESLVEDTWGPDGVRGAYAWALVPRPGGGFLLGGNSVNDQYRDRPWLVAVSPAGRIERENLFPDAESAAGRVGGLAVAGDQIAVAAQDEAVRGYVRLLSADRQWSTSLAPFCAGGVAPTRPEAFVALHDGFAAAGWRGWVTRDLWLARFDTDGRLLWLRTFGPLTEGGAQRVALARSAAGGFALAATRCADEACEDPAGEARFWHLDDDGGPFGEAEATTCP